MAIKLGTNIDSIKAQRRLGEATSSLEKIYERLSSGQRINRASDDAAGLAIAEELNLKNRVFTQAIRNGNDGISLLNIADSTVEALSGIVTRIRELAEQSANGSYSNTQRKALDAEAQALSKEFTRIKTSTSFNGIKLFDGTLGDGLNLQLGFGAEGSINASVGGAIGTGNFAESTTIQNAGTGHRAVTLGDLNGDGVLDMITADQSSSTVSIMLGNGDGTFKARTTVQTGSSPSSITLGDLNGDGVLDIITADSGSSTASIMLGTGDGTFKARTSVQTGSSPQSVTLGDLNGDGVLDITTADALGNTASIILGNGDGTFKARTTVQTGSNPFSITLGDLNGDGIHDIITADLNSSTASIRLGNGDGTFKARTSVPAGSLPISVTLGDLNGDGILDIITADFSSSTASILLGNGDGTFKARTTVQTGSNPYSVTVGDLNGDGILDIISADSGSSTASIMLGKGDGTFKVKTTVQTGTDPRAVTLGDLNGDGVLDIVTADAGSSTASIMLATTQSGLSPLLNFSLKTKADALQSMGILTNAQNNLSKQRGVIGANQSRVEIAINNLISSKENFAAAESRIRDADIAADAANLVRTQILQQAATAVLAQANQAPALALTLLR
jgi:flagellin-like hook-associated protein FlgL